MKRIWKVLIGIGIGIVVILVVVFLSLDSIVKAGLEKGGTMALGTPTAVRSLDLGLLSGSLSMNGFSVRNPEGYPEGYLVELEGAKVGLKIGSLLSDTVEVEEIVLEKPVLRIVSKGLDTNLSAVLGHAQEFAGPGGGGDSGGEEQSDEGPGKRFRIGLVKITAAQFEYQPAGASPVTVTLPDIELKELSDRQGKPLLLADVFSQILQSMTREAIDLPALQLPPEINESLERIAAGDTKAIEEAVKTAEGLLKGDDKTVKAVGDLLRGIGGEESQAEKEGQ